MKEHKCNEMVNIKSMDLKIMEYSWSPELEFYLSYDDTTFSWEIIYCPWCGQKLKKEEDVNE